MQSHPYAPFIKWAMSTYFRGHWEDAGKSKATMDWLKSFGITAGRVDAFLRRDHQEDSTLPNSLVLDIVELSSSRVRQTLEEEGLLDALLYTWTGLANVYGRVSTPAHREMTRLELVVDAGHALVSARGTGFPGTAAMIRQYWRESERLDLNLIRRGTQGFKHVGSGLELIKLHREVLRPTKRAGKPAPKRSVQRMVPQERNEPRTSPAPGKVAPKSPYDADRLPALPTSGARMGESAGRDYGLFGNWRDHWRNMLD